MLQIPTPTRRGLVVVLAFALLAGVVPATLRPLTASASTASQQNATATSSSQTADASTTSDANATATSPITPSVSYGTSSVGDPITPTITYGTTSATTSPSAPLSLAATPGSTTIALTWSTPQTDGGSAVTQYNVERSTDGATWSSAATVPASTSPLGTTLTGLTNGTAYYVRVSATNAVGTGPASSTTVTPSTNASSPLTPGQGTVPIPAGGYPAAVAADSPVGYWKLDEASGSASAVDSSGNSLNGTPTAVTFGAANSSPLGGSAASFNGTSSRILLPRSPAFVSGDSTVEAWINPATTTGVQWIYSKGQTNVAGQIGLNLTGGALVGWYSASAASSATGVVPVGRWSHVAMTVSGGSMVLYVNGTVVGSAPIALNADPASADLPEQIGSAANDAAGATGSNWFNGRLAQVAVYSSALPASRIQTHWQAAGNAPGAAAVPTATAGDQQVRLDWAAPASNGGSAVIGYRVEASTNGSAASPTWSTVVANTWSASTTFLVTGLTTATQLTNGTAYWFRVTAITSAGAGTASAAVAATPFGLAGPPTALAVSNPASGQVQLSWTAPSANGGLTIAGYRVEQSANGGGTWTVLTPTTGSTGTSFTVTGLTDGQSMVFRVAAVTAMGVGSWATASTNASAVATAPRDFAVTTSDLTFNFSWVAPTNTGGFPITGYRLESCQSSLVCVPTTLVNASIPASSSSYTAQLPSYALAYTFRLTAITAAGLGAPATVTVGSSFTVSMPDGLSATASDQQVVLSWSAPTQLGSMRVQGYQVEQSDDRGVTWVTLSPGFLSGLTYTVRGLTNGSHYLFRIRALTSAGLGSPAVVESMPTGMAGTPRDFAGTSPASGTARLTWSAPTDLGGLALRGYKLEYNTSSFASAWSNLTTLG
ncbi:MAG: hypothetical protein F2654_03145, partial [Actinobacteria bacterium]|nr:hypothetical protein [Actinomycetota bacterium]